MITVTALFYSAADSKAREFDPIAIYLTWQYDPTTSMTIDWHTTPEHGDRPSVLQYKKLGDNTWREGNGSSHEFPHSDRTIHRITLRHLEPGTTYRFRFGSDSKAYLFETMPADLSQPLRFAAGGDTGHDEDFKQMNRVVMEYDIDFVLWGGDLSYANGDPARIERWYGWFDGIKETLIDENGRVIPIVVAIGNHELFGERRLLRGSSPHHEHTEEELQAYLDKHNLWNGKPTYFFHLFAFPGRPSYNVLDFGDYMSIFALDSNHYSSVTGGQTGWLEAKLADRQDRAHLFPVYHVPAFPSNRLPTENTSTQIRENWVPLFEQYGVRVSFENHDHAYKRTHPILNGEVVNDGEGIVYLGDGSWVAGPNDREHGSNEEWYIDQWHYKNHGIIVTLQGETQEYVVVSSDGEVLDTYSSSSPRQ